MYGLKRKIPANGEMYQTIILGGTTSPPWTLPSSIVKAPTL